MPASTPDARSRFVQGGSLHVRARATVDVPSRSVVTLPITADIPGYHALRLFPATGTLPTQPATYSPYGPEPEYIAISKDGTHAYVGLQEANGIAVLDLKQRRFEKRRRRRQRG